jgi:hypothetical protein
MITSVTVKIMKHKYLLLIITGLTLGFVACKKENDKYPIVGKWQQIKLRLYMLDSNNTILYDTTYLQPFTSLDYAQFNNNGTAVIGTDHYYYPNDPGEPKTPELIPAIRANWDYTQLVSKYLLTPPPAPPNPGGFDVRDTVSIINTNTLMLHSILYSHIPGIKSITDSYYTK